MVCPSPGVPWNAPELRDRARPRGAGAQRDGPRLRALPRAHLRHHRHQRQDHHHRARRRDPRASRGARPSRRQHRDDHARPPRRACGDTDWVVLELSSFQIESVREPRCAIACVLNVTPDHLDRHGDFAAYAETKRRLVRFALDDAVLGFDDPITREMAAVATCRVRYFGLEPGHHRRRDARRRRRGQRRGGRGDARAAGGATSRSSASTTCRTCSRRSRSPAPPGLRHPPIAGAVRDFHAVPHRLADRSRPGRRALGQRQQGDQRRVGDRRAALLPGPDDRVDRWRQGCGHVDRAARRRGRGARSPRGAQRSQRRRARRGARAAGLRRPHAWSRRSTTRCAAAAELARRRRRRAARPRVQELRPVPRLRGSRPRLRARPSSSSRRRPVSNA